MTEAINIQIWPIPSSAWPWIIGVLCVIVYSVVGAIVAGITSRLGWDGSGNSIPCEVAGMIWPLIVVFSTIVLAAVISYWTVFLPARIVFNLMKKK